MEEDSFTEESSDYSSFSLDIYKVNSESNEENFDDGTENNKNI